jgi:hypothetical protein
VTEKNGKSDEARARVDSAAARPVPVVVFGLGPDAAPTVLDETSAAGEDPDQAPRDARWKAALTTIRQRSGLL